MSIFFAQAVSSAFLIDPVKPVLVLVIALAGAMLVSRLTKDIQFCGLPSMVWHTYMIGGIVLGLLLVLACPIFWLGWPLQIAATASPFMLYWPKRNNAVPEKLRFVIGGDKVSAFFQSRRKTKSFAGSTMSFKDAMKKDRVTPGKGDPGLASHQAVEALLMPIMDRNASRVDLVVKADGVSAVITVDGVRSKTTAPTVELAVPVVDMMKDLCGLDLQERRKKQTGSCWVTTTDTTKVLSVMVAGGSSSMHMRIDVDLDKRMGKRLDTLGLLPQQMKLIAALDAGETPRGVVLIASAAGQGLTTTCLALLATHDAFTASVKALEKNCVHRIEGVDHQLWSASSGIEFHTQLQSIVRRSPDVVYVDDVTEPGSGKVIAASTSADIRFYVALAVDGVGPAVTEWFRAVGDVKLAATPLRAVIALRTLRKLCGACHMPFEPSPEQAKRLGIPAGKSVQMFRVGGKVQIKSKVEDCPMCKGTGYSGQIGIFEVIPFDDESRAHLAKGDLKSAYNAARMKFKTPGLQESALLRVRDGTTSLDEVVRVFTPATKPAAAPTPKPKA